MKNGHFLFKAKETLGPISQGQEGEPPETGQAKGQSENNQSFVNHSSLHADRRADGTESCDLRGGIEELISR